MFEIAWSKLMLIGVVALIVIGPKDLPAVLRGLGEAIGKLRRMADDFRGQFNDAMKEAELDGLKKDFTDLGDSVRNATSTDFNPINTIREEIKGAVETRQAASAPPPPVAPLSDAESRALEIKMAEERLAQLKAEQELSNLPLPAPPPPLDISPAPAAATPAPAAAIPAPAPTLAPTPASASAPPPKAAEKGAA
jgi:sec-independent protein translocase protein TatB